MRESTVFRFSATAILSDIRFWILFLFLLRLIGITNAPLEIGHNWRQALTNMITRNFVENGANLLYPMIDMAGEKTGIIGSEFPFFNYLGYLFSVVFDYSHWSGRLINLVVSSFGLFYFYRLIKELYHERLAFSSTLVLAVSIWFGFSRKIMPDTFSVSLVIIGLYFAFRYLKDGQKWAALYFFLFCTMGVLCKIPALSFLSLLGVLIFIKEIPNRRKTTIFLLSTLCFVSVCGWYFYWVPHLLETYQYQLYFPKSILEGYREIYPKLPELFEKFYFSALQSYVALACCLAGIFVFIKGGNRLAQIALALFTIVFILFILKTGAVFPTHSYYVLPFVPIMALLCGFFLVKIPVRYQSVLLALIVVEAIANQQHDFFIKSTELYKLELQASTDQYIPPNDLIIINGGSSPQSIYFANRKGWTVENEQLNSPLFIDSLRGLGAKYLIIDKSTNSLDFDEHLLHSGANYSFYRLAK
ncbi:MAG: glycosyltransferase family 39 protein [Bacteroidetes bacterium]|nr:glycosyltransferase family 39 protein [Bacteroidota bacterium]